MDPKKIEQILKQALSLQEIYVKGEGSHYEVIAIDPEFDGMSRVKQQQKVYAPLMEYIKTNEIHALTIKAYTPEQWARDKKLMSL